MSQVLRAALTALPRQRPSTLPDHALLGDVQADRDHLARYQQICGFPVSDRLPPSYPHVLGFDLSMRLMTRTDFPFGVLGLLHVRNRIEQARPLDVDEPIKLAVQASDLRDHPRGRQFDLIMTASVAGAVVWREVSTYLRRTGEKAPEGAGRKVPRHAQEPSEPPRPHAVWQVGPEVGRAYAAVSGDRNPIHTSWLGARLFGFSGPIAHGMWSKARCLAAIGNRLPDECTIDVAFKLPILLPARVGFAATAHGFSLHDARSGRPHLIATIG